MGMNRNYVHSEPARAQIDSMSGPVLLEFGAPWCQYCMAAQPLLASAFEAYPQVRHIKVEDGKGRPLGRSYRVKLWPTIIFLSNGNEVARLVRPSGEKDIRDALAKIDSMR